MKGGENVQKPHKQSNRRTQRKNNENQQRYILRYTVARHIVTLPLLRVLTSSEDPPKLRRFLTSSRWFDLLHMDASDNTGSLKEMVETVGQNGGPAAENCSALEGVLPAEMLRIKQQMSNQCFEMAVQLNAGKSKRSCSTSEAERELPNFVSELERVKGVHFNSTLVLHRLQMWHAIGEKMKQAGPDAAVLKTVSDRCMALCSQIKQLQIENRNLQNEITEIQKQRLEIKRLTHEKMKEMEGLMSSKEHPEKYNAVLEKGLANLEKYKKMTIVTQNVLRGILLACKVNWLDDPTLRETVMTLEEFPISD
ncbi:hypothetical protein AMECASPLE_012868 [Ameca splendens]|uniref:Centromere protein H C-terminal domain-containing protein n=1 Tax=Ameca splendens TaxID=208324 RepID=A0ABV0XEA6_9TELE